MELFNIQNAQEKAEYLKSAITTPFVECSYMQGADEDRVSLMLTISIEPKNQWNGGALENSKYAKIHISKTGEVEKFSGNLPRFKKRTCFSVEEIATIINLYATSPQKFDNGGLVEVGSQSKYHPAATTGFTLDTYVPTSMSVELRNFNNYMRMYILNKYGLTVEQYVALKLHYASVDDLFYSNDLNEKGERKGRFSKEQVDAIATSIFNYEENQNGIIIADQTGVGKGRQAAGLIRYAILELGKKPFFLTQKKHLMIDIYRDLIDIGFDANIPEIVTDKNPERKENFTEYDIVKEIKSDLQDEDVRVEYSFPDEDDEKWFSFAKLRQLPHFKGVDEEDLEKYEAMSDELIELYRQHFVENGYFVTKPPRKVSEQEINRLLKIAEAEGKRRLRPFAPSRINIENADGDVIYQKMTDEEIKEAMGYYKDSKGKWAYDYENAGDVVASLQIPDKYDLFVMPYTQIRQKYDPKNKTLLSPKYRFYQKFTADNVLIMDEAHEASGGSTTFEVMSSFIQSCAMGVYLSATYAKRPDNMPLYAKNTSLKESGLSDAEMIRVFTNGSTSLQEAVSAELVKNGQLLRREKQIQGQSNYFYVYDDGKEYGGSAIGTQQRLRLDNVAKMFTKVREFEEKVVGVIKNYRAQLPTRAENMDMLKGSKDEVKKSRGIKALSFQMFNFFLIGIKIDQTMYEMMQKITNGKKTIVTIANTMEAALSNMPKSFLTNSEDDKYKIGDEIENDFKLYLAYLLFYTMKFKEIYEVVDDQGNKIEEERNVFVFDSDHPLAAEIKAYCLSEYHSALAEILSYSTGIPISPIDVIKDKINGFVDQDGYKHSIEEITGRQLMLTFNNGDYKKGTITRRSAKPTTAIVKSFNENDIDHLIVNKSGAVGISMHARPVGKANVYYPLSKEQGLDTKGNAITVESGWPTSLKNTSEVKKRAMLVLQMELDINAEVQKLGRISRTGQVYPPEFTYIVSSIPSESRLTAMMEQKLRSLSANVSSNQEQSSYLFEADDFFGDIAVKPFEDTINEVRPPFRITKFDKEAIKDATKVFYFLDFELQKDFYNTFSKKLGLAIEHLKSIGAYTGKLSVQDYKAETIIRYPFQIGNEQAKTSFGRHSVIEKANVNVFIPKKTEVQISEAISLNLKATDSYGKEQLFKTLEEWKEFQKTLLFARLSSFNEQMDQRIKEEAESLQFAEERLFAMTKRLYEKDSKIGAMIEYMELLNQSTETISAIKKDMASALNEGDMAQLSSLTERFNTEKNNNEAIKKKIDSYKTHAPDGEELTAEDRIKLFNQEMRSIKSEQRNIDSLNKTIRSIREDKNAFLEMVTKTAQLVEMTGAVSAYKYFKEDVVYSEDGYHTPLEYNYTEFEAKPVVITGVSFDYHRLTRSAIDISFCSLTESDRLPVSQIFPKLKESEIKGGKRTQNEFYLINDTYKNYWDNEVVKKTSTTVRQPKWFITGSILKSFKASSEVGLLGSITKFNTIDGKQKLGVEIKDNLVGNNGESSVYKQLEIKYNTQDRDYTILFDGNERNFDTFITGYMYDFMFGKYYEANLGLAKAKYERFNYNRPFLFQISTGLGFAAIVVYPSEFLQSESMELHKKITENTPSDTPAQIEEMSMEAFIKGLSIRVISTHVGITDLFYAGMKLSEVAAEYYPKSKSGLFPSMPITKAEFRYTNAGYYYYQYVIPTSESAFREAVNNYGHLDYDRQGINTVKSDYEGLLKAVSFLEKNNALPTLGVTNDYFKKYQHLYNMDDFITESQIAVAKVETEAEKLISQQIEELLTKLN